jgi:hypothetical protein
MQTYLDQKRSLADRLRLVGSAISDADLQLCILHGLNIEYDSLVVSLNSRPEVVSFNELTSLYEQHLQKHNNSHICFSSLSCIRHFCCLSSPSLLSPSPSSDQPLMAEFHAFLASRGN